MGTRMSRANEVYCAKTLADLQKLEKKYGYKYGWALKIHEARNFKVGKVNREPSSEMVQKAQAQTEAKGGW